MKSKTILISLLSILSIAAMCLTIDTPSPLIHSRVGAENSDYTLTFTSSSNILNPSEDSEEIFTELGSSLEFSYSGYSLQTNEWGRLTQNGYLLNETPISGLVSLEIFYGSTKNSINIYYGWKNDEGQIEYESLYETISGSEESRFYYFNDENPSYFKLEAQGIVDIHRLTLKYSCVESEKPEANIVFGADPFNGTSSTSVVRVGMALYYDATENDAPVPSNKVAFTVESPQGATPATIGLVTKLGVNYLRATDIGTYVVKLSVEDSQGRQAIRTKTVTVSGGTDSQMQAAAQAMYPSNILTQLDYFNGHGGPQNEWVIIGKDFSVFQRVNDTRNYATAFVPFSKFEGGQPLGDFTISFKYTSLNQVWKLLFTCWTGTSGSDLLSGDFLRLLVHNNSIGIQGDREQNSAFQDNGEATGIPLKTQPVYIKFTRVRSDEGAGNYKSTFKLYTSTDGVTYTLKSSATSDLQYGGSGSVTGPLTGFVPFSIDNDFIIENLSVSGTVFTL